MNDNPLATDWRVDFRSGQNIDNNARTTIQCPYGASEYNNAGGYVTRILVGHDSAEGGWPPNLAAPLWEYQWFLVDLYRQGYLNTAGLMPILEWNNLNLNYHGETEAGTYAFQQPNAHPNPPNGVRNIWSNPCKF